MALEALRRAIETEGVGIGESIVKVDSFLNHRIDVSLCAQMGQAIHDAFAREQVDVILTVEASGIAVALTTAMAFGNIPVVFAKKSGHLNVGSDVYSAQVYSFTHQTQHMVCVSRPYLKEGMRVLIVDDFLANGEAIEGLLSICRQARCVPVGAAVCVEKGFQPGGSRLREQGLRVVSLATVDAIEDGHILLRDD